MSQKKSTPQDSHKKASTSSKVSQVARPKLRKANFSTPVRVEKRTNGRVVPSMCFEEGVAEDVQARIAARAHDLFEQRGRVHGFDQEDWLKAELQILGEIPQF